MSDWDPAASTYLRAKVADLHEAGAVQLFHDLAGAVWRRNVDAHDPQLGDTNRSLGVDCSENLRELVVRSCVGGGAGRHRHDLTASVVENSLRVDVAGVQLGVMKAPPSGSRTPGWSGPAFHWEADSEIRRAAAERNSSAYRPHESGQVGRQLAFQLETGEPDVTRLKDLLLVWSGQMDPALTAGWVGLPCLGHPGWLAVEPLWWDESDEGGGRREDENPPLDGDSFADLPAPEPLVRLKGRQPAAADQAST